MTRIVRQLKKINIFICLLIRICSTYGKKKKIKQKFVYLLFFFLDSIGFGKNIK